MNTYCIHIHVYFTQHILYSYVYILYATCMYTCSLCSYVYTLYATYMNTSTVCICRCITYMNMSTLHEYILYSYSCIFYATYIVLICIYAIRNIHAYMFFVLIRIYLIRNIYVYINCMYMYARIHTRTDLAHTKFLIVIRCKVLLYV